MQFAYWGIFFWLPAFLARPVSQGGAGMGVVGSLGWIIPVQIGAYFGYLTFGFIADRLGRRRTFILFMLCRGGAGADLRPDGAQPGDPDAARAGPRLLRPRLLQHVRQLHRRALPTAVRATAQGTSYNIGRMAGAVAPYTIGAIATLPGIGIGLALGDDVGVLPARRDPDLHAARSERQALEA